MRIKCAKNCIKSFGSTNAFAESYNAKIKDIRRDFRGVCDINFFLFRLNNVFGYFSSQAINMGKIE